MTNAQFTQPLKKCTQVLILLFLVQSVAAQYQNIRISATSSNDPEEVTITINPTNPLNLAAGANLNYYYYSTNGGLNWTQGLLGSTFGVWGDPCVTAGHTSIG